MSTEVRLRLEELTANKAARRQRMAQLREVAAVALARVENVRSNGSSFHPIFDGGGAPGLEGGPVAQVNVLDQVQGLLLSLDADERDHWSEDDAVILHSLDAAWTAAVRKGYGLEELVAILRAIAATSE